MYDTWLTLLHSDAFLPAFAAGSTLGFFIAMLVGASAYRLGRHVGLAGVKRALDDATASFSRDLLRRERSYQRLLATSDRSSDARHAEITRELEEARQAEKSFLRLAAQYQSYLERRRWFFFRPHPENVLLAEILRERNDIGLAMGRLALFIRSFHGRLERLPGDMVDELNRCLQDPVVEQWAAKAGRPQDRRHRPRLVGG
jgi:hypothetical protein